MKDIDSINMGCFEFPDANMNTMGCPLMNCPLMNFHMRQCPMMEEEFTTPMDNKMMEDSCGMDEYYKKPSEDHWLNKEEDYANDYCDCVDEEGCYKPNGGKNMYHCPPY